MADPPARFLDWDSEFFGLRVGRVVGHRLSESGVAAVERWCSDASIDVLYFLADLDPETTRRAESHGFHQVDLRITLDRSLDDPPEAGLRRLGLDDLPLLAPTAREAHRDSRFFCDGGFDRERCGDLYALWLEKSIRGERERFALGADVAGAPAGYVTVGIQDEVGSIGLIAVREPARGHGVGTALVSGALAAAVAEGACRRMEVVTQGRNIAAQRLYQRHGFRTRSVRAWYHRWFSRASPGP